MLARALYCEPALTTCLHYLATFCVKYKHLFGVFWCTYCCTILLACVNEVTFACLCINLCLTHETWVVRLCAVATCRFTYQDMSFMVVWPFQYESKSLLCFWSQTHGPTHYLLRIILGSCCFFTPLPTCAILTAENGSGELCFLQKTN